MWSNWVVAAYANATGDETPAPKPDTPVTKGARLTRASQESGDERCPIANVTKFAVEKSAQGRVSKHLETAIDGEDPPTMPRLPKRRSALRVPKVPLRGESLKGLCRG
jgi:hypothetical protein